MVNQSGFSIGNNVLVSSPSVNVGIAAMLVLLFSTSCILLIFHVWLVNGSLIKLNICSKSPTTTPTTEWTDTLNKLCVQIEITQPFLLLLSCTVISFTVKSRNSHIHISDCLLTPKLEDFCGLRSLFIYYICCVWEELNILLIWAQRATKRH